MQLQFIDNAGIDRKTRKLIRSHVAKGKNVGKVRQRSRRQDPRAVVGDAVPISAVHAADCDPTWPPTPEEGLKAVLRQQNMLPTVSFPSRLNASSEALIRQYFDFFRGSIFPAELYDVSQDFAGSMWIQLMFFDDLYLSCSVAISAAATGCIDRQGPKTTEAAIHLGRTLRLLNERLSGDEALRDTTLAAVVALTQYERFVGQYRQGLIHFHGLERLVELRGGIARLNRNHPALAQKIFRADLEFALQLGCPARYNATDTPGCARFPLLRSHFGAAYRAFSDNPHILQNIAVELRESYQDVLSLVWCLNGGHDARIKLREVNFHNALIYIGYRLVGVRPLSKYPSTNPLETTLHLGLICFLVHFLVGLNRKVPEFRLLSEVTRLAARDQEPKAREEQELFLWLLLIAGSSIFDESDDIWLIPKLHIITFALDVRTWEEVCDVISKYPWVKGYNDKQSEALWTRSSMGTSQKPCHWVACDLDRRRTQ